MLLLVACNRWCAGIRVLQHSEIGPSARQCLRLCCAARKERQVTQECPFLVAFHFAPNSALVTLLGPSAPVGSVLTRGTDLSSDVWRQCDLVRTPGSCTGHDTPPFHCRSDRLALLSHDRCSAEKYQAPPQGMVLVPPPLVVALVLVGTWA